jgi:site-specific recombinase XerD
MKNKVIPPSDSFGPLSPYVDAYFSRIKQGGFADQSIESQTRVLRFFGRWLRRTGCQLGDLHEEFIGSFLRWQRKPRYMRKLAPATLGRLLSLLRERGVVSPVALPPPTPAEEQVSNYATFLAEERNMAPRSIVILRSFAATFLRDMFGDGPLNFSSLKAEQVGAFIQRHAYQHGPAYPGRLVPGTRSFLRYLHYKGLIENDLSLAVPKVACWALSALPSHLSAVQVRRVLRCCEKRTALGRRNYAILLLLARLGLRAGEVTKLNLEDIDWDNSRLTLCGKGGQWAQLPMPADVAQAIALYLRRDRPRCACRRVFIRAYAPLGGLADGGRIGDIVKAALEKAGVISTRKGAHVLRHSLATDMLRRGASLDEIGEVLRHHSPNSTAIYAKVDLKSLRKLAVAWPGGVQ